jgi:hypothetical protein
VDLLVTLFPFGHRRDRLSPSPEVLYE